jgi:hypothetical protein
MRAQLFWQPDALLLSKLRTQGPPPLAEQVLLLSAFVTRHQQYHPAEDAVGGLIELFSEHLATPLIVPVALLVVDVKFHATSLYPVS